MDLNDEAIAKKKLEAEEAKEKARIEAEEAKEKAKIEAEEAKEKAKIEAKEKAAALAKKTDAEKRLVEFEEKEKELNGRILTLEDQVESQRADKMIIGFKRAGVLAPAKASIVKTLLMGGKSQTLNFEDKEISVRDLVVKYFEGGNKIANFEEIAAQELEENSVKSLDNMTQEEVNAEAEALAKEKNIRLEDALNEVTEKHFKAPK